jgi:anaerobic ribonucleoside-triphosphate reductase
MSGQRCPLCGESTAAFDRRRGCWACRCGWTDRRPAARTAPRRSLIEAGEEDEETVPPRGTAKAAEDDESLARLRRDES